MERRPFRTNSKQGSAWRSRCRDCGTGYRQHGRQKGECRDCGTKLQDTQGQELERQESAVRAPEAEGDAHILIVPVARCRAACSLRVKGMRLWGGGIFCIASPLNAKKTSIHAGATWGWTAFAWGCGECGECRASSGPEPTPPGWGRWRALGHLVWLRQGGGHASAGGGGSRRI
jgi:hypothetical protein